MSLRRGRAWPAFSVIGIAICGLAACASVTEFSRPAEFIELSATPFFAQTEHHCGPAALATLLAADAVAVTPEQLAPLVYVPGREGSLQAEIIAAARRYGRVPVRVAPQPEALIAALADGKPVLVLQNLGLRSLPHWHYAVLVGFDPLVDRFILRSGTTPREALDTGAFLRSWDGAERWALVVAEADRVPGFATPETWIAGAAAFESIGRVGLAHTAYKAAAQRWPEHPVVWQALANALHLEGDAQAAEQALRRALDLDPRAGAARNNLASLLLARGCPSAASRELDRAVPVPPVLEGAFAQTRLEIEAAKGGDASDCPR